MAKFDFGKYCTPAQVYLVLAVIGLVSGFLKNFRVLTLIFNTIFVFLFAWILNFLCSKGLTAISWVLVLLPFVLLASTFFLAMDAADHKDHETVVILEGMEHEEKKEETPSMEVLADEEKLKEWCSTRDDDNIYCSDK
tara:strand:- start:80242 stop:80655 length:414 start_codon:yes stop_codon:yes gene_type:complete